MCLWHFILLILTVATILLLPQNFTFKRWGSKLLKFSYINIKQPGKSRAYLRPANTTFYAARPKSETSLLPKPTPQIPPLKTPAEKRS